MGPVTGYALFNPYHEGLNIYTAAFEIATTHNRIYK